MWKWQVGLLQKRYERLGSAVTQDSSNVVYSDVFDLINLHRNSEYPILYVAILVPHLCINNVNLGADLCVIGYGRLGCWKQENATHVQWSCRLKHSMYSLNFALKLAWRFSKLLLIYLDHTMMHDACTAAILAQEGWEEMFQSHMTRLAQIFLPSDFCCTCYFIQRSNGSSSVWHSHWTQQKGVQEKWTGIIQVSTGDVEFTLETKLALGCENFPLLFFPAASIIAVASGAPVCRGREVLTAYSCVSDAARVKTLKDKLHCFEMSPDDDYYCYYYSILALVVQ